MFKNVIKRAANILRVVGYVFLLMQWLWVILLYSSLVIETGTVQTYIDTAETTPPAQEELVIKLPDLVRQLFAGVILISMVALSVILLVRVPRSTTKITIRATKVAAKSITPTVEKIVHVPKKQRKQLAEVVLVAIIVFLSLAAYGLVVPIVSITSLPVSVAWFVSIWLLVLTLGALLLAVLLDLVSRGRRR